MSARTQWNPSNATPADNIQRTGGVKIGPTANSVGIGTSKLLVTQSASGGTTNIIVENTASFDPRANISFVTGTGTDRNLGYLGGEGLSKNILINNLIGGSIQVVTNGSGGGSALKLDNTASFDSRAQVYSLRWALLPTRTAPSGT